MKKRYIAIVTGLVLAASLLAGCGSGTESEESGSLSSGEETDSIEYTGEITELRADSFTMETEDGESVEVTVTDDTVITIGGLDDMSQPGGMGDAPGTAGGEAPEMPDGDVPEMPDGDASEMPDGNAGDSTDSSEDDSDADVREVPSGSVDPDSIRGNGMQVPGNGRIQVPDDRGDVEIPEHDSVMSTDPGTTTDGTDSTAADGSESDTGSDGTESESASEEDASEGDTGSDETIGDMPEMPDGDNSDMPEMPDGDSGDMPEMPDGDMGNGDFGSLSLSLSNLSVGDTVTVTLDAAGNALTIEVQMEDLLEEGGFSGGTGAGGGPGAPDGSSESGDDSDSGDDGSADL